MCKNDMNDLLDVLPKLKDRACNGNEPYLFIYSNGTGSLCYYIEGEDYQTAVFHFDNIEEALQKALDNR